MIPFRDDDRAAADFAQGFNPFGSVLPQNRERLLDAARRESPVFFSPAVNAWVVTSYRDAEKVLKDPDSSRHATSCPSPTYSVLKWPSTSPTRTRPR